MSGVKSRVVTGLLVGAVVLSVLFLLPLWTHLILLFALYTLAQLEVSDLVQRNPEYHYDRVVTTICGVLYLLLVICETPAAVGLGGWVERIAAFQFSHDVLCLTPIVLLICAVIRRKTQYAFESFALSFAGFWYIAVLLGYLVRLDFGWSLANGASRLTGPLAVFLMAALVKFSDIGAYFVGMRFGRRRLIPEVSPKKSIEGVWGGYAFSWVVSFLFWGCARLWNGGCIGDFAYTWVDALMLPPLLVTAGIFGDLAESIIKRSVNVKDSGGRFPGMGGILDILDSLIFAAPVAYLYLHFCLR